MSHLGQAIARQDVITRNVVLVFVVPLFSILRMYQAPGVPSGTFPICLPHVGQVVKASVKDINSFRFSKYKRGNHELNTPTEFTPFVTVIP